jgi:hypothetical protein
MDFFYTNLLASRANRLAFMVAAQGKNLTPMFQLIYASTDHPSVQQTYGVLHDDD